MNFSLKKIWSRKKDTPKKDTLRTRLRDQFRNAVYGDFMHTRQNANQTEWMEARKESGRDWCVRIMAITEDPVTGQAVTQEQKNSFENGLRMIDAGEKLASYADLQGHDMAAIPEDDVTYFYHFMRREAIAFDTDYRPHPTDNGHIIDTDALFTAEEHEYVRLAWERKMHAFKHLPDLILIPPLSETWGNTLLDRLLDMQNITSHLIMISEALQESVEGNEWYISSGSGYYIDANRWVYPESKIDNIKKLAGNMPEDLQAGLRKVAELADLNFQLHMAYRRINDARKHNSQVDKEEIKEIQDKAVSALQALGYGEKASSYITNTLINNMATTYDGMKETKEQIDKIKIWVDTVTANIKARNNVPLTDEEQQLLAAYEEKDTTPALPPSVTAALPTPQ